MVSLHVIFLLMTIAVLMPSTNGKEISRKSVDEHLEDALKNAHLSTNAEIQLPSGEHLHALDIDTGSKRPRITRAAGVRNEAKLWPNGVIPYKFRNFGRTKIVLAAMRELEKGTCLDFKPVKNEKNHLVFANKDGCHSKLGMVGGGQVLSLAYRGCRYRDTVLHEMLHAVGIIHEQERPDRDKWVDVQWKNLKPGAGPAYDLTPAREIKYHGVPYDFSSIMHYSLRAFSKDRKTMFAMIPINNKHAVEYVERSRDFGLSFEDYKLVNRMYSCGAKCKINCPEPAYVTKECECITKPKFYELHCKGDEKAGWCLKYKLEGDIDDHLPPDTDVPEEEEETEEDENVDPNCKDLYDGCKRWAKEGQCDKSHSLYNFVSTRCERSCKLC